MSNRSPILYISSIFPFPPHCGFFSKTPLWGFWLLFFSIGTYASVGTGECEIQWNTVKYSAKREIKSFCKTLMFWQQLRIHSNLVMLLKNSQFLTYSCHCSFNQSWYYLYITITLIYYSFIIVSTNEFSINTYIHTLLYVNQKREEDKFWR